MKARSILALCFLILMALTSVVAGAEGAPVPEPFTHRDNAIYTVDGMAGNGVTLTVWGDASQAAGSMTWMSYGTEDQVWFVGLLDTDGSAPGMYQFNLFRPTAKTLGGADLQVGPQIGMAAIIKSDLDGEVLMNYRFDGGFSECENFSPPSESCAGTVYLRRLTPKPAE
jgi:hypothetical protein